MEMLHACSIFSSYFLWCHDGVRALRVVLWDEVIVQSGDIQFWNMVI